MHLVDQKVGVYIACQDCFDLDVILADLVTFSAVASLLLLAACTRSRIVARVPHLLCGLIFLVYIADLVVFSLYNSRLLMTDVALFYTEGAAVWNQFSTGLGGTVRALSILAGILALFGFLWWMPGTPTRSFRLTMAAILALSLGASAVFKGAPYVNDWAVENVFSANMSTPSRNRYQPETEEAILDREFPSHTRKAEGGPPARGRNVLVVIIESWSAWHSALFGGFEDWTPSLDAAALRGLRFDNFHSIGFSTDKGLVGILAGQQIWAPFLHWFETPPFHSMWGIDDTLPGALGAQGYHTAFLTAGPLDLYRKGEWLRDLGFDEAEGNEHPFYEGWPRFAFGSAPDRALYQRGLQWISNAPEPWMLVLETVSTHQPYKDPESGERSLELVMKYADRQFSDLLRRLDAAGFFEGGVLLVASDHRSMTPMSRRELDIWGPVAHSRIPAFVIGTEFTPGSVDDTVYSQSDLTPTFEWWASGEVTLGPFEAVMFDTSGKEENCALHERSDWRGMVEVNCNEGRGQIMLDGEHTRFVDTPSLSPERQQSLLDMIARQRLEAWQRHQATESD
jgi:phosphoglycerol transferase MdoB-like AlkP superfamily enzyme